MRTPIEKYYRVIKDEKGILHYYYWHSGTDIDSMTATGNPFLVHVAPQWREFNPNLERDRRAIEKLNQMIDEGKLKLLERKRKVCLRCKRYFITILPENEDVSICPMCERGVEPKRNKKDDIVDILIVLGMVIFIWIIVSSMQ